jgi:hypothetical protein
VTERKGIAKNKKKKKTKQKKKVSGSVIMD